MGLLDKLLNKDEGDSKEAGDWLAKLDKHVEHSIEVGTATAQAKIPASLGGTMGAAKGVGPVGDVTEHLQVLQVLPGATWQQISQAYADAKAQLGPEPSVAELRRVNSAYAALRVNG